MNEQQCLLTSREPIIGETHESSAEEWSDDSSCNSYYSDSDSSVPEWESSLDSTGQILYIDCHPFVTQTASSEAENKSATTALSKNQTRQSTRGKFLKLLRRRDSKRRSKKFPQSQDTIQESGNASKVTFQDYQEGEIKEIVIRLNRENCFKFGRRTSLTESLLGVTVSSFPDSNRVMIAGFSSNSDTKNNSNIKIGEWLKTIDNVEVNVQNVNSILEQVMSKEEIVLKLQRVAGVEVTKEPPTSELKNLSNFVHRLLNYDSNNEKDLSLALLKQPASVVFLNMENLSETGSEFDEVLYCYPKPCEKNLLCISRGIFITLDHLLNEITKSKPQLTSVMCRSRLSHVTYNIYGNKLLLLMLPDNRVSEKEILLLNNELVRMLQFMYQTVDKCFENSESLRQVDHFFSRFLARALSSGLWTKAEQFVELQNLSAKALLTSPPQFEGILPAAHFLPLPNEVQVQIDDALSELEASDYRDWNEDPLDCQRLFTILGSAYYHAGYLVASHFIHGDLIDVHFYCRQQGLFHMSRTEPVKTLVLWREVFPFSCNRGLENKLSPFKVPEGRRYLLIIGSGKDLLAVIMEAGGCTEPPEENMGPDAFYVEEVQATLAHLQELGISEIADRWIATNPGTQVTVPEVPASRKKSDFLSFAKSSSPNQSKETSSVHKKPEVTSILKRRSSDQGPLSQSGSLFSLPDDEAQSEDSTSQEGYSERSEVSDEPVVGRRAIRERKNYGGSDEDESDIDDYREGSQMSNGSYDLSELRQALLHDSEEAQPLRLTNGVENVLFHYVQFDSTEGMLLCPMECRISSPTLDSILNNFRSSSQCIHKLFQNTLRFKVGGNPVTPTHFNVTGQQLQHALLPVTPSSRPDVLANIFQEESVPDILHFLSRYLVPFRKSESTCHSMPAQDMAKTAMNKSLIAIKEHGTLFECDYQEDNVKKSHKVAYWVIGRLFYMPYPREIYVCYQDTVPQNLIDVAFKLGISLAG